MSTKSLGVYLATLRLGRGYLPPAVAAAAGTSQTHLWRIEHGEVGSIGATLLHRLVAELRGSLADVHELLLRDLSEDEARARAVRCLHAAPPTALTMVDVEFMDAESRGLIELALALTPAQRVVWLRIGEVLQDTDHLNV
jgi:transcriptional regulator with XRE-family HTH domain